MDSVPPSVLESGVSRCTFHWWGPSPTAPLSTCYLYCSDRHEVMEMRTLYLWVVNGGAVWPPPAMVNFGSLRTAQLHLHHTALSFKSPPPPADPDNSRFRFDCPRPFRRHPLLGCMQPLSSAECPFFFPSQSGEVPTVDHRAPRSFSGSSSEFRVRLPTKSFPIDPPLTHTRIYWYNHAHVPLANKF